MNKGASILVMDDDPESCKRLSGLLNAEGFTNLETVSYFPGYSLFDRKAYATVICDIMWDSAARAEHITSHELGFSVLDHLRANSPQTIVILVSKYTYDLESVSRLVQADGYVSLLVDDDALTRKVVRHLNRRWDDLEGSQLISTLLVELWKTSDSGRGYSLHWLLELERLQRAAQQVIREGGHLGAQDRDSATQFFEACADDHDVCDKASRYLAEIRRRAETPSVGVEGAKNFDVFICHAEEDKDAVARPLASCLRERGLSVWYDEEMLATGDRVRERIDRGLQESLCGVVVISRAFFKGHRWMKMEFDWMVEKELREGSEFIIPVLHNVPFAEMSAASTPLAGRAAISTEEGVERVASKIHETIERRHTELRPE